MVGDFGWEHEGTECQVDIVKIIGAIAPLDND